MKVELLHSTPLWVCAKAIRRCWASEDKSDTVVCDYGDEIVTHLGTKDKELIERVGNKNKHKSTLEHLVYTFDIDGISRACLQELARHRLASYSVKSTRYTLKELKEGPSNLRDYLVQVPNENTNKNNEQQLMLVVAELMQGISNDQVKYMLPEAYKTSLVMTINARSLQNFLELRTSKSALWEIQDLAREMYDALPEEHKYLFEDFMNE